MGGTLYTFYEVLMFNDFSTFVYITVHKIYLQ